MLGNMGHETVDDTLQKRALYAEEFSMNMHTVSTMLYTSTDPGLMRNFHAKIYFS